MVEDVVITKIARLFQSRAGIEGADPRSAMRFP